MMSDDAPRQRGRYRSSSSVSLSSVTVAHSYITDLRTYDTVLDRTRAAIRIITGVSRNNLDLNLATSKYFSIRSTAGRRPLRHCLRCTHDRDRRRRRSGARGAANGRTCCCDGCSAAAVMGAGCRLYLLLHRGGDGAAAFDAVMLHL
eukprot:SAG31_NODE_1292_length_8967_cov_2.998985_6_plen_147_part_00